MSQNTLIIDDGTGAEVLAAVNAAVNSLVTQNSGNTEPAEKYAFMPWADTTTGLLKIRNAANSAWITVGTLADAYLGMIPATQKAAANGVASLGPDGKVPSGQLPTISSTYGLFFKADPSTVAFSKTGAGTANIKAGTYIYVGSTLVSFGSATAITMPTLTAGTDYAVWVKDDATIQATTNHTSAPGAGNWRKIGGFHYAPGGHSGSPGGGNSTPQINEYSFWDLKFRPACPDPRGMVLVAESFWSDIYLLGVDHLTNGTSKYGVTIADGSSPPKIPTKFGGTGSNAYGSLNWWEANEVLRSWGKRSPTYSEFAALAYGTTEASSIGSDPGTTSWSATYLSKWGCNQASGVMWIWGDEFGGGAAAAGWTANTGGRGSTYQMENAVVFGGRWGDGSNCGSRCSLWNNSPPDSYSDFGARGVCDHLILD